MQHGFPCAGMGSPVTRPNIGTRGLFRLSVPQTMERPCNRFPCTASIVGWTMGPWSACVANESNRTIASATAPCRRTLGMQARNVQCTSSTGLTVPDSLCLTVSPGAPKPPSVAQCTAEPSCTCSSDLECDSGGGAQGHWVCAQESRQCVCASDWDGNDCSIPRLRPPDGASACVEGLLDAEGHCCLGFIDTFTSLCCPNGSTVDATGRCCTSGRLDACGVCDGVSVAVDALGTCCVTALPPSGICCVGALVDDCGVCGGSNTCG